MPSRELIRLRPQLEGPQKLRVSLYDDATQSDYAHEGELQFSDVTVDQTTGTVLLRSIFPNPDRSLLPGMFLRAQLHLKSREALLVPQSAAVRGADGLLRVWVIGTDDKVFPQTIEAQQTVDNNWLAESGIESGMRIVTQGFQKIHPGVTVKPTFDAPLPAPQLDKAS